MMNHTITVCVVLDGDIEVDLPVKVPNTVGGLKIQIADVFGVPAKCQRLFNTDKDGKNDDGTYEKALEGLNDELTLEAAHIRDGSNLSLLTVDSFEPSRITLFRVRYNGERGAAAEAIIKKNGFQLPIGGKVLQKLEPEKRKCVGTREITKTTDCDYCYQCSGLADSCDEDEEVCPHCEGRGKFTTHHTKPIYKWVKAPDLVVFVFSASEETWKEVFPDVGARFPTNILRDDTRYTILLNGSPLCTAHNLCTKDKQIVLDCVGPDIVLV